MKNLLQIIFWVLLFSSCHKDKTTEPPVDFGYNYFPDEVGRYTIYDVDSIVYDDPSGVRDTFRYRVKEQITAITPDNSGRPTMRIERYFKIYQKGVSYDSIPWSTPRIWTANKTATTLERKEENNIYIKLTFPARKGKKWNGNSYNTLGEKQYEITYADQKESVNNISFDSVLMVTQFLQQDAIEDILWEEKYARNVGLIYRQRDSVYTVTNVGYRFTQKIVSYGK